MNSSMNNKTFYNVFRDISTSVHSLTRVKDVLELVARKSTEVLNAKGTLVRILNLETSRLELAATYGLSDQYLSKGPISSHKIITELCQKNRIIIIDDIMTDPRIQYPQEALKEGIQMVLDVPLVLRQNCVGIIRIFFSEFKNFSNNELALMISIAEQCAFAIEKSRLLEAQQSQYQHLALQTEKMSALGRMAAGIAHEINNPLAGILLYGTNLLKKVPKEGPLKKGLEVIIQETMRCKSIIQELLEFSREGEPRKTLVNINDIIEKALSIMENEFHLHHIHIEKNLSSDLPAILLDVNKMTQVVINLLLNAIEAIQELGVITVRSFFAQDRECIHVEIEDTGCGIPKKHLTKIFEPFFSTKTKGTGLGLAVSYGIVENHQGNFNVSSRPGRGSNFSIELPIIQKFPAEVINGIQ